MNFKATSIFLISLIFAILSLADVKQSVGIGSSEKYSAQYFRQYVKVENALNQKMRSHEPKDEESVMQARQLLLEFKSLCNDEDALDTVLWESFVDAESGKNYENVSFACTAGYDKIKGGKTFNFVLNSNDQYQTELKRLSSQDIKLEAEPTSANSKPTRLRIVIVETTALAVGVVGTFLLVSKMFPNEGDKVLHAVGSSLFASALTSFLYHQLNFSPNMAAITSFVITGALGAAIEVVQPHFRQNGRRGDRDRRDLHADLAGAFIGSISMRWAFNIL